MKTFVPATYTGNSPPDSAKEVLFCHFPKNTGGNSLCPILIIPKGVGKSWFTVLSTQNAELILTLSINYCIIFFLFIFNPHLKIYPLISEKEGKEEREREEGEKTST